MKWKQITGPDDSLPNASLITEPGETVDMISISFQGLCAGMISGDCEIGSQQIRGERKGILRLKSEDMYCIWEVFSSVIFL